MTAYVIGASDDFTSRGLDKKQGDILIAADGGYSNVKDKSLIDLVVGDFDSLGYVPDFADVIKLKREKDDTDTDFAAEYAVSKGADEIAFYGCMGGKPDHALANVQLCVRLVRRGIKTRIVSRDYTVYFIDGGSLFLKARKSGRVSVFSPDRTEGVAIKGLKYEADGITLTGEVALGVSNEFIGKDAEISAQKGVLIIFVYEETDDIRS